MKNLNNSINQDMNRIFDLKQESTDVIADFIQPTVEIRPNINIIKSNGVTTTASTTIYAVPADRDFYVTTVISSFIKDAVCDIASNSQIAINCTKDGLASVYLARQAVLTLTAQNQEQVVNFPIPIKIDRGTNIIMTTGNFTVGLLSRAAVVIGYTQETKKGV
jgi:hypothetical protein